MPIAVHVNWIDESRIVSSPRVTHTQCSLPPCRSVKLDDRVIDLLKLVRAFDQHCVGHFQGYDVPHAHASNHATFAVIRLLRSPIYVAKIPYIS